MKSAADVWTLVGLIVLPILAGGTGMWLAGFTMLRSEAKARRMTYREYLKFLDERRK